MGIKNVGLKIVILKYIDDTSIIRTVTSDFESTLFVYLIIKF